MHTRACLVLAVTTLAACLPPPLVDCSDDGCVETSQPGTGSSSAPVTDGTPLHTATGDEAGSTDSTGSTGSTGSSEPGTSSTDESGYPVDAKPEIYSFTLSKDQMFAPGEVDLQLDASEDVVEVDVWYGDTVLATVPTSAFPYTFDVTSQAMCNDLQTFAVTVRDAGGLTDDASAELLCQLPAPGSEVYTRTFPGTMGSGGTAIAALPDGAVIVAGVLDGRMALWRLDPGGDLLPNWPRTITGWTLTGLGNQDSTATAVALDSLGAIVVAGYIKSGTTTRRYLARLSEAGELLWEDAGIKDGEEISGVAVAVTGEIAAGGSLRTNLPQPDSTYDSSTWVYPAGYHPSQGPVVPDVFGQPESDPIPDEDNGASERAHAVVAHNEGFVVFGEREYKGDDLDVYSRATAQRYTLTGERDGVLWTSAGTKFLHDAALAATKTDTGFLAVGWCRHHTPNAPPRQACVQEFDADGHWIGSYAEPSPTSAEARAVAQDRELKAVLGGFLTKPGQTDAWIFASRGADQPLAWSQKYDADAWDFATGLGCDLWGRCTWVGTTTVDGTATLIVSRRQP